MTTGHILTFDDGPHPTSAKTLLATLKAEHVPATFFVVGSRVKEHPEIVKEMIDEGHAVGNHTQDHIRLDTLPPDKIAKQIEYCETNVERATGHRMGYLRPPGMRFNDSVLKVSTKLGYTIIGWNIGAKDFIAGKPKKPLDQMTVSEAKTVDLTPELVTSRVLKQLKKGTIILLHDNPVTAAALPAIIRQVRAKGFEFVSVQKMMQALPQPVQVASNPVLVAKTSAKMR